MERSVGCCSSRPTRYLSSPNQLGKNTRRFSVATSPSIRYEKFEDFAQVIYNHPKVESAILGSKTITASRAKAIFVLRPRYFGKDAWRPHGPCCLGATPRASIPYFQFNQNPPFPLYPMAYATSTPLLAHANYFYF